MKKYLIYCIFTIAAFGCNSENKLERSSADVTEANLEAADTTLTEKIIKTADMRFRVKDVQRTKEKLSTAIRSEGGTVTEFSIQSNIQNSEKVRQSADSLLELTAYRTEGYITAKVPSDKLDEFTNKIAKLAVFIDQQSLKLDDQSVAYLANQLKNQNRVEAVAQLNKHANKKSNNVETSLSLKDDYVDKKIENLIIDSKVKYSNITLNFYQDNTVKKMTVENDNLSDYRPGFFKRFWLSIQTGWVIFTEIILTLTNLWVLFVLGIIGYFVFKYYKRKLRPVALKP
ncbi:DUF4349 domain-containing protein [Pedobacter frigoris]|uniref:DUF4349 domain-containing protein n=1 Tax=Pedobacter frigoris TaxID=2571272 RepID=A0A4U1CM39_9SPHI|nr:DUF4349 domain-containing protein [Pedobacter frigoris]TKC07411.1 DUF4349 domain-containing protein [Pedobacter frigoris]